MASKDKPYRVYQGGRAKGPVRQPAPKKEARRPAPGGDGYGRYQEPKKRKRRWGRRIAILLLVVVLAAVTWVVLGYLAFRSGVEEANARLDPAAARALAPPDGSILSTPTNLLLLGADVGGHRTGSDRGRSDSIMVIRTDPDAHRIAYLSIPRDLRVDLAGEAGFDKINASYSLGGPAATIATVQGLTGLEIHHVAIVDFATFGEVVDALGGITVNVRKPILSNKFECPLRTPEQCESWEGWRFAKGPQRMDGRRALVFSRIRENKLDPNESDITRGERQQQVVQAITDEATSLRGFLRMPMIGDDLVKPLATDLSASELLSLGWVKFRAPADQTLHCRLGGRAVFEAGVSYIEGTEENVSTIAMVKGETAPQPPLPGSGPFGPGCIVGRR